MTEPYTLHERALYTTLKSPIHYAKEPYESKKEPYALHFGCTKEPVAWLGCWCTVCTHRYTCIHAHPHPLNARTHARTTHTRTHTGKMTERCCLA